MKSDSKEMAKALASFNAVAQALLPVLQRFEKLEREQAICHQVRAISVKSKNVEIGSEIEWPNSWGRGEVLGWVFHSGQVTLLHPSGLIATMDPEQRVRVYRDAS